LPFDDNKEFPNFFEYGPSSEELSNYWHGENGSTMELFIYLFIEFITQNSSYKKFVEDGKAYSVYRLGFGPGGFGFGSLYRQDVFPLLKSRIRALGSTYSPTQYVPRLFAGFNWTVRDVDHSTPKVVTEWICTSTSPICLHFVNRNNFTILHKIFI
jgi:hypothetical protein